MADEAQRATVRQTQAEIEAARQWAKFVERGISPSDAAMQRGAAAADRRKLAEALSARRG